MDRAKSIQLLMIHNPVLCERFGVISLALFGSTVCDTASDNSDVDILP